MTYKNKNKIQAFDKNLNILGRDFIVGDIHGYYTMLRKLLDKINFNPKSDRLFSLGDLIDRGPESKEILSWLKYPWFFAIMGNHERMMKEFFEKKDWQNSYVLHGGKWFIDLDPYSQGLYVEILNNLPHMFEIDTINGKVAMVHAEVPVNDWIEFKQHFDKYEERSLWSFDLFNYMNNGNNVGNIQYIDHLVHGHVSVDKPMQFNNRYYIDTGAIAKTLTLMEINHADGFKYHQL